MGRLVSLSQTSYNGAPDVRTVLYRADKIKDISVYNSTGSQFKYPKYFEKDIDIVTASNTAAALAALVNTANTTNTATRDITVTIKNLDGTTRTLRINTDQIFKVFAYPTDANDSSLFIEDPNGGQLIQYRIDELVADILTAANG